MLRIELLNRNHNRGSFDCGQPTLNEYLLYYARQNDQKNISRTFVAVDEKNHVFGYYSINSASVNFEQLPKTIAKKLPAYPIPAARLSRLAVDLNMQGQGLGERLLINSLKRIYLTSQQLGIKLVIVDALNENAKSFYEHYGFISFLENELKLFLVMETIIQLFEDKG